MTTYVEIHKLAAIAVLYDGLYTTADELLAGNGDRWVIGYSGHLGLIARSALAEYQSGNREAAADEAQRLASEIVQAAKSQEAALARALGRASVNSDA